MSNTSRDGRFVPYLGNGIIFTLLGPTIFWYCYPLGPTFSVLTSDLIIHTLRYKSFRQFVFPKEKGFNVTKRGYLLTQLPTLTLRLASVEVLYYHLGRKSLTIVITLVTIVFGYIMSRLVFKKGN